MVHVALELFEPKAVELLLVRHRAERRDGQRLGLAAGEEPRAVRAWQHADLDRDLANVLEAAAVDAHALVDDALADAVLELLVEELAEDVDVLGEPLAQLGDRLLAQLVGARLARRLVGSERCLVEAQREVLAHDLDHLLRVGGRRVLVLRLADLLLQLDLRRAQLLDRLVRHLQSVDHRLLGDALGAGLDHQDGVGGAGDHQVELRVRHARRSAG